MPAGLWRLGRRPQGRRSAAHAPRRSALRRSRGGQQHPRTGALKRGSLCASTLGSGTARTRIPAARPAWTPALRGEEAAGEHEPLSWRGRTDGESSTTRQRAGSTPRRWAARRKMSGAGLPRASSGSSPHTTTRAGLKSSGWAARFFATACAFDEVAIATGTWFATWSTTRWAPGSGSMVAYKVSRWCSHSSMSCCGVSLDSIPKCSNTIRAQ